MSRHPDFVPQGVIPAVPLPFHEDFSIDEPNFRAHLRDDANPGWLIYFGAISAIAVCNAEARA